MWAVRDEREEYDEDYWDDETRPLEDNVGDEWPDCVSVEDANHQANLDEARQDSSEVKQK